MRGTTHGATFAIQVFVWALQKITVNPADDDSFCHRVDVNKFKVAVSIAMNLFGF
jgi:hypothetical protein